MCKRYRYKLTGFERDWLKKSFFNFTTMSIAEKYRPYYTYEDYCQWEGRWELIEGMPYAMSPLPIPEHQRVCGSLFSIFKDSLRYNCKDCKVYLPLDWKISDDTIVQPDVLIVCKKIEKKFLDFAPVLVIEILSPATAPKDRGEKMELYQSQKVKYYLIVDAQFNKIEVYTLNDKGYGTASINPENCSASINFSQTWNEEN